MREYIARPMAANVRHSSESTEHFTPMDIVEAARITMGGIDFDPASTEEANKRIGAESIFTRGDNGFVRAWPGRVFLNPPGGRCDERGSRVKVGGQSSAKAWWRRLAEQYTRGIVEQAVFVGFSLEILQVSQVFPAGLEWGECSLVPLDFPICYPSRRVAYERLTRGRFVPGKQPPHASFVAYLPPRSRINESVVQFKLAFEKFGHVVVPVSSSA